MNNENVAIVHTNNSSVDESVQIMAIIEKAALNSAIDVDKMQKLLDMQEKILDRKAKHNFSVDFVRMKSNLPKIIRTKNNTQTKSRYASLDDINEIINPILNEYNFGTSCKISQTDKLINVTAVLWHRDGHSEETTISLPLDKSGIQGAVNKTDVHAIASSTTYGKRLALCALLNLSTGDESDNDGNYQSNEPIATEEQQKAIEARVVKLNKANTDIFKGEYPDTAKIKKSDVNTVVAKLNKLLGGQNA